MRAPVSGRAGGGSLSEYVLVLDLALIVTGATLALALLLGFDAVEEIEGIDARELSITPERSRDRARRLLNETGIVSGQTTLVSRDGDHVRVDYDARRVDGHIVIVFDVLVPLPVEISERGFDESLPAAESSAYVQRSIKTLERWVEEGRLPPPYQPGGPGSPRRWKRSDLDRARRGE